MRETWRKAICQILQSRSRVGFRSWFSVEPLLIILFVLLGMKPVRAQNPFSIVARTPVAVAVQPNVSKFWKVRRAYLEENLGATIGYLEIQNASDGAIRDTDLYAEYYDGAGRLCFSLVFSLGKNLAKKRDPIGKGEVRKLYSIAAYLAPASEPTELRLFLLRQAPSEASSVSEAPAVRAPITIEVRNPTDQDRLRLTHESELAAGPILDLALADVTVDSSGRLEKVGLLGAISDQVRDWFLKFVTNQVFYTATTGGVPETGRTLLLLRAIVLEGPANRPFEPARTIPWIASYVEGLKDTSLPPITEMLLRRPPTKVKIGGSKDLTVLPEPPPGVFEPLNGASDWCPGIFIIVPDPTSPNHFRRKLASETGP